MQDYNTIIGVLTMRHNQCSLGAIQDRHRIGSGTIQLILRRFESSVLTLEKIKLWIKETKHRLAIWKRF